MAKVELSSKRLQISKANLYMVTVVSIACFVSIFALTASKALLSQRGYQAKVISQKVTAKTQLQANLKARDQLVSQYKLFVGSGTNIIGGSSTGTGDRDGDSAKIILDALPSKYDYPALATSLEKLMTASGLSIGSITGTDDELNQSGTGNSGTPTLVDMPFVIVFDGQSANTQDFLSVLQRSIRPMQVQQITITGSDAKLSTSITAKTYYQPEKSLTIKKEVVQ
ncbi:MAG: hypothetical protein JWN82_640 [Candidatus Saccharibacteria bacterium]|nr:hypothetical protein [Candidatus Saccharibacteria bacterium]